MLNLSFKPHRTHLKASTADAQKVFVMLKLIPQAEVAKVQSARALALVIDTSSSMLLYADQQQAQAEIQKQGLQGQQMGGGDGGYQGFNLSLPTKLDRAIEAAHGLVDDNRLLPNDKITVIHFDDNAKTILPLTPLANKALIHQAIDSLRQYSGGTHMGKGLQCAQQQLGDLPPQTVKRVLLLTDGQTFDEPDCEAFAPQFAAANTPLIAIGIGEEYNQELLIKLSASGQGRHYHLQTMTQLSEILNEEVGSSVREVVTDLQATVATVKSISLDSLTRIYPSLAEVSLTGSPYKLGNIIAGDYTVFIFEFTISGIARPPSRVRLAQIGLAGHAPGLGRREEFPIQELFINFTTDEAQIAVVDPEVMEYVQQKNLDRMVQDAIRLSSVDVGRAKQTLQVAANMTKRIGNAAVTKMLNNALDELNQTGKISANTARTVRAGGRTKTMKPGGTSAMEAPPEDVIRRLTGA